MNSITKSIFIITITKTILVIITLIAIAMPLMAANTSLYFEGNSSFGKVVIEGSESLKLNQTYTIEAWIKPASFNWLAGIVSQYNTAIPGFTLRLSEFGTNRGIHFDGMHTADSILTADTWYHLAAVNNNGTRTLYVNGTAVTLTGTPYTPVNAIRQIFIGKDWYDDLRYFNGKIEEVRIWKTVRSQAEVQANMYKELAGTETDLAAYYQMNEGSGTIATDKTANHNNGTLINMDDTNWQNSRFFTLSLQVSPANSGTVSGSGTYWASSTVNITAAPATDFQFVNWTANSTVVSTSANFSYTIPAASSNLTANFEIIPFTDINAGLPGYYGSSSDWGDYDNDGDLDILAGSEIYRNDMGAFTGIGAGLTGVSSSSAAWGDYDNDGDLDILLTGYTGSVRISKVYRNNGNSTFTDIGAGLTGVSHSSVAWGDYDNDGDLDILLTGDTGSVRISKVYRNNGNSTFTDINAVLTGVDYSSVSWGDYDNDGDPDILLTGRDASNNLISKIYRNNGNSTFTDINAVLTGVGYSSVAWGDYDNDGDPDILLTGDTGLVKISKIYRNNGNSTFTDIGAGLTGCYDSSVAWGDYDNDGDPDILLTGYTGSSNFISQIHRNDGGVFTDINASLSGVYYSSVAWGDYDNDGDLDILLMGWNGSSSISKIYRNNSLTANTAPAAPANLSAVTIGNDVTFSWDKAMDTQTPQNGLSYNIYVGTSAGTGNKKSPMSNITNGYRKVVELGNANQKNSWTIKGLSAGDYYWSVQAVDHAFAGSVFSSENIFGVIPVAPVATSATNKTISGFTANWNASTGATGYSIDVDDNNDFSSPLTGYNNLDVGNVTTKAVSGLTYGTTYYYRVRACNTGGTSPNSNSISATTLLFLDINASLTGVELGSSAWGDYDNDGDLDILLTGNTGLVKISNIYRNNGNSTFTDIGAGLTVCYNSSVAWGDYDNDGYLDILLTGYTGSVRISKVYRNNGNSTFTDINAVLSGVELGSSAWGDYDNDGDLDILLSGYTGSVRISKVYRNNGNSTFTDINAVLPGVNQSSAAWGDYDNDGDLDLLLTGSTGSVVISQIYRNEGGVFTDINAGLPGFDGSSSDWGDYDNDGDLDILITGYTSGVGSSSIIFRNDMGVFTDIGAGLTGVYNSSAVWGDYDNDGDVDILLTGYTGSTIISKIYRNNGNSTFTDINAVLPVVNQSSVAWGDYDNDGKLDILFTGNTGSSKISKVYRNNSLTANTAPAAPANLSVQTSESGISFSWAKATDNQTPQNGLSYNIAVGSTINLNAAKSSHSNLTNGYRKVAASGNTNQLNSYKLSPNLPQTTYRWSVQAIDNAFAGSGFTAGTPVSTRNLAIFNDAELTVDHSFVWESAYLDYVTGYQIQISATNTFTTTIIDTLIDKSSLVTKDDKGFISLKLNRLNKINTLQNNTTYYWRIKPMYNAALETFFSPTPNSFVFKTETPDSPTNGLPSGTSVAITTTTLSWTAPASGVTPTSYTVYFYSEADLFTSPIINGADVTETSYSGLTLNDYTLYKACVFANYDPAVKGTSPALEWYFRTCPGSPVPLISSAGNTITILWELVRGATSYKIYSSTEPYGTFTEAATVTTNSWSVPISATKYFYYVVAVN